MSLQRVLIAALLTAVTVLAAEPWKEHGRLEVSQNGRYIQHRDGTPFLWLGDTAWAMIWKLSREDVRTYLDDRQKKGFNVIQTVAYWYPHGEDGPGPHNAPNVYGHRPFEGGVDEPDTARAARVKGGSPDSPNDYWDHTDFVVREIRRRGMYLALLPCWGRAFVNSTFEKSRPTLDEVTARAYGAFLGKRYGKEPHIIWVIGGDINPTKGVGDRLGVFRAMAETIGQAATGAKLAWNLAHPKWADVFMTYHPDGDPFSSSSKFFHSDPWLDVNGIETFKSVDKVYPAVARNYGLTDPVKPTLLLEGAYEGGRYQPPGGPISDLKVRRQAWQAMLAGAAGHTYGASSMWHFVRKPRADRPADDWKEALGYAGAQQVAALMRNVLTGIDWWNLIPDQSLIAEGAGRGETLKAAARSEDGKRIAVYFPDETPARLDLPGSFSASWVNLQDGSRVIAPMAAEMAPPAGWPDALLVVERVKPRVIVTTDINIMRGDPDDRQSLVHLLWYLDELDVKAIVADRSGETKESGAIQACNLAVDAYAKDYADPKVRMRALGFPAPETVRRWITPREKGPQSIIDEVRRQDGRPLYVLAWGTMRVLHEALQQAPEIAPKLRVLSIGTWSNPKAPGKPGWNSAGREDIFNDPRFRSLWWIENSVMFRGMFQGLSFEKVSGPGETSRIPVAGEPFEFLKKLEQFGALGRHMTELTQGNEWARYFRAGDTPAVLYLLEPKHMPELPEKTGWAGEFEKPFPAERPNHWTDTSWGQLNHAEPARTAADTRDVERKQIEHFAKVRAEVYGAMLDKLRRLYVE